jgi:hypothetical protein
MLVDWMGKESIVQRILRTNLHQRQYVQEVSTCRIAACADCNDNAATCHWSHVRKRTNLHQRQYVQEVRMRSIAGRVDSKDIAKRTQQSAVVTCLDGAHTTLADRR